MGKSSEERTHTKRTFGHRYTKQQFYRGGYNEYFGTTNPQHIITKSTLQAVFSDSPAAGGVATGQWTEDEIAEAIFDWWISGKPYKKWYADKYLQRKFDF